MSSFRAAVALSEPTSGLITQAESVCIINLPKIVDQRGNLTFIEGNRHIPFSIERVYYLYDVPAGAVRGGHAHKKLQQFVIAASGSFTVIVNDGRKQKRFFLNRPHYGLYIPRMIWRELDNFSSGSICVVLASEEYDESDYYRDYDEFRVALDNERHDSILRSASHLSRTQRRNRDNGNSRP